MRIWLGSFAWSDLRKACYRKPQRRACTAIAARATRAFRFEQLGIFLTSGPLIHPRGSKLSSGRSRACSRLWTCACQGTAGGVLPARWLGLVPVGDSSRVFHARSIPEPFSESRRGIDTHYWTDILRP